MQYLLEKAPKPCFDTKKRKELKCTCLSCLDDHSLRNAVALWTLRFARLEKETQQMILMEKIRATNLLLAVSPELVGPELPLYFIPFTTELPEVADGLREVKICKYAMMLILRMGRTAWLTCKHAVDSGTTPQHGMKGKDVPCSKGIPRWVLPEAMRGSHRKREEQEKGKG